MGLTGPGLGLSSRSRGDGALGIILIAGRPRRVGIRGGREGGLRLGADEERFAAAGRTP